jgi:Flp pilus assembly protein TadD
MCAALVSVALITTACGGSEPTRKKKTSEAKATPETLLADARKAKQAGQPAVAEKKYKRAIGMEPTLYDAVAELTQLLIDGNRATDAVAVAKDYFDRAPGDPKGYRNYALAQTGAGQLDAAYDTLSQAIELDGNDAAAWDQRGRLQILRGKMNEGVEDTQKATQLDAKNVDYMVSYGSALHRAGKLDQAAMTLRSALQLDENHVRALLLLAMILREGYEHKEALSHLLKASRIAPDNDRVQFELGLTLYAMEDAIGAEAALEQAVKLKPGDVDNWYAYGQILLVLKKWEPAITAYKKVLELQPKHPKAHVKLGLCLYEAGKLDEAEVVLTTAQRNNPSDPYVYWNLARIYEKGAKFGLAVEAYGKFVELAPKEDGDVPKAKKKIAELKKKIKR